MRRLNIGQKLSIAFLIVLMPILALIVYDYNVSYSRWAKETLDDQLRTAQAVGALVDASIDDAFSVAWSFSNDPVIQTMDHLKIDPYLESQAALLPQFDDVAVFDAYGNNVGSMALHLPPDALRPGIGDREYFQTVKSTGQPFVSNVLISKATGQPIVVIAVPMKSSSNAFKGVTIASLDIDYLVKRVSTVGLRGSQAIFVTDPNGLTAFHTGLPLEEWGHRDLSDFSPVESALRGVSAQEQDVKGPLGNMRMVAATRTPKYGWVVGATILSTEALQPIKTDLVRQLTVFLSVLILAGVVGALLSRWMILRPLEIIIEHLAAFGRGHLERRISLHTRDEMELVAQTFNQMADQLEQSSRERDRLLKEAVDARQELEESQKRREEFMSMVAHEFRNPLTVMMGFGNLLTKAVKEHKEIDPRICERMTAQAVRMRRLVEDLSDVSMIETGRFNVSKTGCDLQEATRDVAHEQQLTSTKHNLVLDIPQKRVVGNWDCGRLIQALTNLVNNAIKYSPNGGDVWIKLRQTDKEALVCVSDQGIGIAPEDMSQLFQPFSRLYRTQRIKGTGLGLFITKAIIEAHGGRIWVESEKGKGSTFFFAIPF